MDTGYYLLKHLNNDSSSTQSNPKYSRKCGNRQLIDENQQHLSYWTGSARLQVVRRKWLTLQLLSYPKAL